MTHTIPMRDPSVVMRLKRLGSFHQSRLSFMRILTRRMALEGWAFSRPVFDIDDQGVGRAVYRIETPDRSYSMVAFAHDLPDDKRSDRVIAEAWDATFTLFDGEPTEDDLTRLEANVPRQEAGRISERELSLSRANRSARLWAHVVEALSKGVQPDADRLKDVGYLMRTTAVYGSGKFGAADYATLHDRPEFQAPFQVEMMLVYLIRTFVRDLVNHMAVAKGGEAAAPLDRTIAQSLGIGNATGLGMAPFIVNHPVLFNNWISAREEAIARVRSLPVASPEDRASFADVFARYARVLDTWSSDHPLQLEKLDVLRDDYAKAEAALAGGVLTEDHPWDALMVWAEGALSEDGQELLASLMLEPYGRLIDDLSTTMCDRSEGDFRLDGSMPVAQVAQLLDATFGWADALDWDGTEQTARAWYVSAEKLEPRLAERYEEPVAPYEQPLAPARDAARAAAALADWPRDAPIAEFVLAYPEHRQIIRRVQMAATAPYAEIRDNTIAADMLPIDMLRAKLSYFGATHFDPRSDRWVRIRMYTGAPYPEDLTPDNCDHWVYPETSA